MVPPENPTAEPEFRHFLGTGMNLYTSRFPLTPGLGLRAMLERYNEVLPAALGAFGGMRLDAAVVACSASHYLLSPQGDREVCAELGRRLGFPVVSSALATLEACASLGVRRLSLVSPYEPWLTELSRGYWEQAGLSVAQVVSVPAGEVHDPYRVTTAAILEHVEKEGLAEDTAVLFTGTGMFTLEAMNALEISGRVLLSSNLAGAWWARRTASVGGGVLENHPLAGPPAVPA